MLRVMPCFYHIMPSGRPSFCGSHPSHRPYLAREESVQCVDPQAFWLAIQLIISVMISRALWGAPICRKECVGWITQQSERREEIISCRRLYIYSLTLLRVVLKAHVPQNHAPRLRSGVALLETPIIIPHQLTIRFRHDRLLRVRVHRRSTVETKPRARH